MALRANAIVLGTVVFVFGSAPDGLATLRSFLLGVAARGHHDGSRMLLAVIAAAFAVTAVPRVTLGSRGWMRALPLDARSIWRGAVAALCMAQLAVVTFIPLCALAVVRAYHAPLSIEKIASLPVMIAAIAAAALPARLHTRAIAAVGVALSIGGTWLAIAGAIGCLALADVTSPRIVVRRRMPRRRRHATSRSSATVIWLRASWRAMRVEGLAGSAVFPIILASYSYFITGNNPEMPRSFGATVTRVCGALAVATFGALLANTLLRTRQPWAWSRSLPWSSTRRVVVDALVLGLPLLIVPIGLAPLRPLAALTVAALVPLAAATGAAALRVGARRQTGAAGECLVVTLVAGGATAVWPPFAGIALAAAPIAIRIGARRDRDSVATRWTELHHDATGDPGWLSG